MPVLIHTDPQRRKSLCDFPLRLLVEGSAPQAPLNTEFHSVAARSANAFDQDQLTAGRGLFLFQYPVLPPFSALDLHWLLPLKAPAFPHGNAGTRHRSFSSSNFAYSVCNSLTFGSFLTPISSKAFLAAWWSRISSSCSSRNFLE